MKDAVSISPKWTQDESISYECARECITDLMGIFSTAIDDEESSLLPDQAKIEDMLKSRTSLAHERMALRLEDYDRIAEIRSVYGAWIRAYREAGRCGLSFNNPRAVLTRLQNKCSDSVARPVATPIS